MKCFECPDRATQQVEVKTSAGEVVLNLCAFHADGYRAAEAWSQVIVELREAEDAGDLTLAEELDREQMAIAHAGRGGGQNEFPEFIDA